MNGYRGVGLVEVQSVSQELQDKLGRFVKPHPLDLVLHTMKARALVAKNRITAFLAGLPKGILKFLGLSVGDFGHSFAFPDRAAAKGRHILREYHLVACFVQKRDHLLDERFVHGVVMLRKAHHLVDAAREIDYFVCRSDRGTYQSPKRLRNIVGLRRGRCPERKPYHAVQPSAQTAHRQIPQHGLAGGSHPESPLEATLDTRIMFGGEIPNTITQSPRRHIHSPQLVGQVGHIDAHRAGSRAKAISGASLLPGVGIFLLKRLKPSLFGGRRVRQRTQRSDFPLRGDSCP